MTSRARDPRLLPPQWQAVPHRVSIRRRVLLLLLFDVAAALWYFGWLVQPQRVGQPVLYGLLLAAELFNVTQAAGFWWTCLHARSRRPRRLEEPPPEVDVLIPVYGEPVEVVEPTVAAAASLRGADVHVWLLDDGDSPEMETLALRHGIGYLRRDEHRGAKAGNINNALARTAAPFVAVFDSDHVPTPSFLEATLGHLADPRVAFVQTPQYYANHRRSDIAAAAWAQQALFFGPIARGKDGLGAMFCCGTNVRLPPRRARHRRRLPRGLAHRGLRALDPPPRTGLALGLRAQVLARGLGPEDMASYVSQQLRWARGCLSAIPAVLRARLPLRLRLQYLLSTMYFLSGWTLLVYMALPVVRILTGAQPIASIAAAQFLVHFGPYFALAVATVALVGAGTYTFAAFALSASCFWVHVLASLLTLARRPGRFVVTAKAGVEAWHPRAVWPALAVAAVMVGAALSGLARHRNPGTLNSIAFVFLHVTILMTGASGALRLRRRPAPPRPARRTPEPASAGDVACWD